MSSSACSFTGKRLTTRRSTTYNYQATKESIERALGGKPTVADVIAGSKTAKHPFSPK